MQQKTTEEDGRTFDRRQAAIALRVNVGKVDTLRRKGVLVPTTRSGRHLYTSRAVETARQWLGRGKYIPDGELEARATELFRGASSDADVVVALRVTYRQARELRQEYQGGGLLLTPGAVKAIDRAVSARGLGPVDAASLPRIVADLCESDRLRQAMAVATMGAPGRQAVKGPKLAVLVAPGRQALRTQAAHTE